MSHFTTFSPMSLLLFCTRKGGQLKPNVHIPWDFQENFSLLTQVRRAGFSLLTEWTTVAMAGPAAAVMGTWRKDRNHGGRGSASSARGTAGLAGLQLPL